MNFERRISNRCHSIFDILRFIIRYLKKAGLWQGAGFRAQGAGRRAWMCDLARKGMTNDEFRTSNFEQGECRMMNFERWISNRQSFNIRYSAVHHSTFKKDRSGARRGVQGAWCRAWMCDLARKGMTNDEFRTSNFEQMSFDIRYSAVHHSTFKKDMVEFPNGF